MSGFRKALDFAVRALIVVSTAAAAYSGTENVMKGDLAATLGILLAWGFAFLGFEVYERTLEKAAAEEWLRRRKEERDRE